MADAMTPESCREHQRECAAAVYQAMHELRGEVKSDIAAIREAVQEIDRNVARIKGFLGINGNAEPHRPPHLHHRDAEPGEHEHARRSDPWQVKVMWGAGLFVASAIAAPILYAAGQAIAKRLIP